MTALSGLIFLPLLGGLLAMVLGRGNPGGARNIAVAFGAVSFALSLALIGGFMVGTNAIQFETNLPWIAPLGINFHVGVDGLSLLLIVTTALTGLVALLASDLMPAGQRGEYCGLTLLLQGAITGAFAALDLVLFFGFWELMLIPMVLLVGMLGGEHRRHAAVKFFLYTAVGSLLMLVAILWLYFFNIASGKPASFDLLALLTSPVPAGAQIWLFLAFALAFAIKLPIFPLHSWLPDTYTQAPLPGLVLGTMLVKVGGYGFLRFCLPLFPAAYADAAPFLATLGVIGIIFGGFVAVVQRDIVRVLAYSSIAHLGFVVLGVFTPSATAVQGAVIQMVNHSITAGALFLVAAMLYRRTGTSDIGALRGLAKPYPKLAAMFTISMFASLGLPGLNGFVGEILIIVGSWSRYPALSTLAALGTILSVVYLLWTYRRVMNGQPEAPAFGDTDAPEAARPKPPLFGRDLSMAEISQLVPFVGLMFMIGLYPGPFLASSEATVTRLIADTRRANAEPLNYVTISVGPELNVEPSGALGHYWPNSQRQVVGVAPQNCRGLTLGGPTNILVSTSQISGYSASSPPGRNIPQNASYWGVNPAASALTSQPPPINQRPEFLESLCFEVARTANYAVEATP